MMQGSPGLSDIDSVPVQRYQIHVLVLLLLVHIISYDMIQNILVVCMISRQAKKMEYASEKNYARVQSAD